MDQDVRGVLRLENDATGDKIVCEDDVDGEPAASVSFEKWFFRGQNITSERGWLNSGQHVILAVIVLQELARCNH